MPVLLCWDYPCRTVNDERGWWLWKSHYSQFTILINDAADLSAPPTGLRTPLAAIQTAIQICASNSALPEPVAEDWAAASNHQLSQQI